MVLTRCVRVGMVLSFFICSSCLSVGSYRVAENEGTVEEGVTEERPLDNPEPVVPEVKEEISLEREEEPPSLDAERPSADCPAPAVQEEVPASDNQEVPPALVESQKITDQELLDSALEFCQASNVFWERGDLDNALDALDKAYSIILKAKTNDDPELLQQREDLRFTISKRIIEIYASRFTVANGSHKAIPLVMNTHVQRALNLYKGREKAFFLDAYRRSGRYRPAIVRALHEAGLPEELSWLPLIESGFKVRALSRARALGPWQFIASTGYKYGLRRDQWIDERMDPAKSTQAAISYLKELHQIFGDWTTVLAAYNCGERRVLTKIRAQKINYLDNFWDLYLKLPRETAFYVPRFLAVLHILNDPEAHDMTLPPVDEEIKTEEVTISKPVHLKTIAKRLDVDYEVLRDINAELRQHCTPEGPYSLKVPEGHGEKLLAELNDIPAWRPPVPAYHVHKVRYGESLSVIADKYKTSVRAIMAMNNLNRSNYLKVGWTLRIPTRETVTSRLERPPAQTEDVKGKLITYVVEGGDSLWMIAKRFGTTTKVIESLNQVGGSHLRIGQVLKVPARSTASVPETTETWRVRRGDSPYLIAKRHKMNLAEFLELNKLTPRSTIFPGQTYRIQTQ